MSYIEKIKLIQVNLLELLEDEDANQQKWENLKSLLIMQQSNSNVYELKAILYLISKISQNHYRGPDFFGKITKIINILKNVIKQTFSNYEIFNFFKDNKRILLLLVEEGIMTIDNQISNLIEQDDYFYPEIKKFIKKDTMKEIEEDFEEKRRIGENDSYICELIRNDNIEEFIIYYNKNNFLLTMNINHSIFETNSFLIQKDVSLIEYSMFFGSIQIVKFLFQNDVTLTPSLWIYAIHGKNPELIHFLEENQVLPDDKSYFECLQESIKCHHNDFAMYFKNNLIPETQSDYFKNEIYYGFRFYNFEFIPDELKQPTSFFYAIEFGYSKLVEYYKDMKGFDINQIIILTKI